MFVLRTGLQGNGKTLNTIKELDQQAAKTGRTIYYNNVTGLNPAAPVLKAEWVEFSEPEKWFELPNNALIVIDEAQQFFRVRPIGSKVPDYASRLEIMRKQGHELHAITQSPKLIDSHMRELCNQHIHYNRGNGGSVIKRWVFQKPNLEVNKRLDFTDGESTRITIDKDYFGCYQSIQEGSKHHFKFRMPKAGLVLIAAVLAISVMSYQVYQRRFAPVEPVDPVPSLDVPGQVHEQVYSAGGMPDKAPMTKEEYIANITPRLSDIPQSAPIYDEITKAVSYPKAFCLSTEDPDLIAKKAKKLTVGLHTDDRIHGCRCLTQQGTALSISFEACMNYVENGYFDHSVPDRSSNQQQAKAGGDGGINEERVSTPARPAADRSIVAIVPDSEYPSRPWR